MQVLDGETGTPSCFMFHAGAGHVPDRIGGLQESITLSSAIFSDGRVAWMDSRGE